ncbi:MAG: response regulator transcription factor [Bacteroidota bacterium]|nr:response regulator transcription factor [Bacteroidota bacterium]MDP4225714.1 response regulator transcription factor [Bacteroidota bacterium]MDP4272921.1 response regulator transcription factor [Bacteroidota bacterium]
MNKPQILLADPQTLTRKGIIQVIKEELQFDNVETANSKEELYKKLPEIRPDLLIIDYDLFDFENIEELETVKKLSPATNILVISDNKTMEDILRVLDCGINDYILKKCDELELSEAITATLNNRKFFCSEVLDALVESKTPSSSKNKETCHLTSSEIEIIQLIAQGLTTKDIAARKFLSFHTVNTHRKNIFRKLGINNTSELIMYAIRAGIVDTTEYYI